MSENDSETKKVGEIVRAPAEGSTIVKNHIRVPKENRDTRPAGPGLGEADPSE